MPNPVLLRLARARAPRRWLEASAWGRRLARRFVAGPDLEDALRAARGLRASGCSTTLDHLGENVATPAAAARAATAAGDSLQALSAAGLAVNISVKLTHLGLDLPGGEELARGHLFALARRARELNGFVRVDMEGSAHTDATLRLVQEARAAGGPVGAVLQAALRRSAADLERLLAAGVRVRLVKGAYREPSAVAFQKKAEVDANYRRLLRRLLEAGEHPAVATHDGEMIAAALGMAQELGLGADRFEFQMLYGVGRRLAAELRERGWRTRIYLPYGAEWYPYFMRRLAERPANLLFLLRHWAD